MILYRINKRKAHYANMFLLLMFLLLSLKKPWEQGARTHISHSLCAEVNVYTSIDVSLFCHSCTILQIWKSTSQHLLYMYAKAHSTVL